MFRKTSAPLPTTSYGYEPLADAVASGWKCPSCAKASEPHEGPPRKWPAPCPDCGTPVDPWFRGTSWEHAAWGAELRHKLEADPKDTAGGGFHRVEWANWRFREGLRAGDSAMIQSARADIRAIVDADRWRAATAYFMLVGDAQAAKEFGIAADELVYWLGISTADGVETDSAARHNFCNAIDSTARFLESSGGASHPRAPEIERLFVDLSAGAFPVLTRDLQDRVVRLSRP